MKPAKPKYAIPNEEGMLNWNGEIDFLCFGAAETVHLWKSGFFESTLCGVQSINVHSLGYSSKKRNVCVKCRRIWNELNTPRKKE